jgi:hypothetical protein
MAESLDIAFELQLPDGGAQVTQANDHGLPLAEWPPRTRCEGNPQTRPDP